jgi:hypothetical protein
MSDAPHESTGQRASFPAEEVTESQFYPIPNQVRVAALQAAVAMIPTVLVQSTADRIDISVSPDQVIANAVRFEAYLTGDQ